MPKARSILQQLYHVGAHGDWDNSFEANWSPSGLPSMHDQDGSHAMSEAEIEQVIDASPKPRGERRMPISTASN